MADRLPISKTDLEAELERHFGFSEFRSGQKELIQALMLGRDALGVMPTGGGKSLCFQLPAILSAHTTLVVSPLIALMKDQVDALRERGVCAVGYHSGLTAAQRRQALGEISSGKARLLYIAPERMQQDEFMSRLAEIPISLLAIDEAHCISHWGHDFRPDYRKLGSLRQSLKQAPVLALTATATQRVQTDIIERLEMKDPMRVITGFRRKNLSFEVASCATRAEKFGKLKTLIQEALKLQGSAVIYAATRKNVERVCEELRTLSFGKSVGYYHAGLDDEDRANVQEDFISGRKKVLVATNAFGMGIDKRDVRLVAHFDIPGSVEAYYQEAGRAGRDGLPGRCVILFNYADVATQDYFIQKSEGDGVHVEHQRAQLKQLVRYAYSTGCRQKLILSYFGDPEAGIEGCGICDKCQQGSSEPKPVKAVEEDVSLAARQMLSALARINGRFGKGRLCEILKGSEAEAFLATGLQHQSTYALLKEWPTKAIRELVEILIEDGYIRIEGLEYPLLVMTASGLKVMKGEAPLALSRSFSRRASKKESAEDLPEDLADQPNQKILLALKAFRKKEASEKKMPPYVIFHDKTLEELAARTPLALGDLSGISGVGPKKLELYGDKLLEVIRSCL